MNISKARKAFFVSGSIGAFQGHLNPLSSRCIYMTCVLPVLLYGSENWVLSDELLSDLESFQAWVGKRILGVQKCLANDLVTIALNLPPVKSQILIRKLHFLSTLLSGNRCESGNLSLGPTVFNHLAMDNVYNITLVRQYMYLEEEFHTNFTAMMLEDPLAAPSLGSLLSEQFSSLSRSLALSRASRHVSLRRFLEIEEA